MTVIADTLNKGITMGPRCMGSWLGMQVSSSNSLQRFDDGIIRQLSNSFKLIVNNQKAYFFLVSTVWQSCDYRYTNATNSTQKMSSSNVYPAQMYFSCSSHVTCHLLTESKVTTGKSQTETLMYWLIARSKHQGLGLRFPCNDRTDEVFYGISLRREPAINSNQQLVSR